MLTRNDPYFAADVSEQHINWETDPDMGSTGGGWGPSVLNYFTSHGVVSETECPAQGTDVGMPPYWPLATGWESRVWKSVSNLNDFTNDTNTMKAYLKTTGPLVVGIWAGHDLFGSVADLKANYRPPDASGFDHEVVLVGYFDDATIPTGGYWIIKNSWGYGNNDLYDYSNSGYNIIPYGNIEIHNDISAITGPVYYTGPMYHTGPWDATGVDHTGIDATNTWKGDDQRHVEHYLRHQRKLVEQRNRHGLHLGQSGTASRLRQHRRQQADYGQRHRHRPRTDVQLRRNRLFVHRRFADRHRRRHRGQRKRRDRLPTSTSAARKRGTWPAERP